MTIKNAKAKGSRRERQCIKALEDVGFLCMKAGASLGAWDVIGISKSSIMLVQVKSNRWPGREEMMRLANFPAPRNALKEVWRYDDGIGAPRVRTFDELAGGWVEL